MKRTFYVKRNVIKAEKRKEIKMIIVNLRVVLKENNKFEQKRNSLKYS